MRTTLAAAALLLASVPAAAEEILVVTPDAFRPTLGAWLDSRAAAGYEVTVVPPEKDMVEVVRRENAKRALRHVLLLGDVQHVPCAYRPADAITKWERDPNIATDAPLADLDGDGLPDLSIGRLPADSVDDARALLSRTLEYERSQDYSPWRRRLNIVGGVGGFGQAEDQAIETVTRMLLSRNVPNALELTFTYGKPSSPYCPFPGEFAATTLERINEGSLITAYVGHGSPTHLDGVAFGGVRHPILEPEHVGKIDVRSGSPLLIVIACSTGHLDGPRDCLAEDVLHRPRGPVAVIASSRVSTPYSNAILSVEMLDAVFDPANATVGEMLLAAKRRMGSDPDDTTRRQIETLARQLFEPDDARREVDRREHVLLYQLLGDPTLRLALPAAAELVHEEEVDAGATLRVTGNSPVAGRAVLQIVRDRNTAPRVAADRKEPEAFRTAYAEANRRVAGEMQFDVPAGAFETTLPIPADTSPGRYLLRIYVEGKDGCAFAGDRLRVL